MKCGLKSCFYAFIFFPGCSNRINTDCCDANIGASLKTPFDQEEKLIRKIFGEPIAIYESGVLYEEYKVGETVIRIEYRSRQSHVEP